MTTYTQLQTLVARDLRDEEHKTFDTTVIRDLCNTALAEIGRIAPERFQEDISPIENTLEYVLRSDTFDGVPVPEIEVTRVEIWDSSQEPPMRVKWLQPGSAEYSRDSEAGWRVWGGTLGLARRDVVGYIAGHEEDYLIRVWGYSPYLPLVDFSDILPFSNELMQALRIYVQIEAMRRLIGSRTLFTQWQTRSNNTDVSPAALMNEMNIAQEEWRRKSKALFVIRETP